MRSVIIKILLIAAIVLSYAAGFLAIYAADCEAVRGEVLRLHIPANSNSARDQEIKLKLRDYLLEEYAPLLSECGSSAEAAEKAAALCPEIELKCTEFLHENGFSYGARAQVCEMHFNAREYEKLILPAGDYSALRVTLGEGAGDNWWCVIFPQLCWPAVSKTEKTSENSALDSFMKPKKYSVKFALYEFFCGLFG